MGHYYLGGEKDEEKSFFREVWEKMTSQRGKIVFVFTVFAVVFLFFFYEKNSVPLQLSIKSLLTLTFFAAIVLFTHAVWEVFIDRISRKAKKYLTRKKNSGNSSSL